MTKRILDCNASDFIEMKKIDILDSIVASEGRVLVSEIIGCIILHYMPLVMRNLRQPLVQIFYC